MKEYWAIIGCAILINFYSHFLIRMLIESIVRCDRHCGYKSLKRIKLNHMWHERLTQNYYKQYLTNYRKAFKFWFFIKKLHLSILISLLCISLMISYVCMNHVFAITFFVLSSLFAVVVMVQFDTKRRTKYDRINKHNSK